MMSDLPHRIAFMTSDNIFESGGVENSIARIARGLASRGIEVDIVRLHAAGRGEFRPGGGSGITRLLPLMEGLGVYELAPWTGGEAGEAGEVQPEQQWAEIQYALLELARERRYDLLQAFYASVAGFPTVYTAQLLRIPSIVSIRGSDLIADVFRPEWFSPLVWALRHATALTAVSQEGLERARLLCESPAKGQVILNSIRPADFEEGVEELTVTRPVIGSLAVFRAKKGIEVLLSAFHMLAQRIPTAHLLLVGYVVPPEQVHFDALVAKYALASNITLTGRIPRSQALRYLRAMDVFAFSSLHDGCPNAVLEAMLAGTPIVAASAGALPEMIADGVEGLLVPSGSAVALYEGITKLLSMDEQRRRAYGERASARAMTQFAPEREIEQYLEVYRALMGNETQG